MINPLPTTEYLWGTHFLNHDTGFVCGQHGTIFRTTDGGENWFEHDSLSSGLFKAITFVNTNKGFVVGSGDIVRTDDCGKSWYSQGPYVSTNFNNIFFLDDSSGWVVGNYDAVLRTRDGGNSWQVLSYSILSDNFYYSIEFISPDTGYISGNLGSVYSSGVLKKTTDGGETWTDIPIPDNVYSIEDIEVLGDGSVWIGDTYKMYYTLNDGGDWDTVSFYPYSVNIKKFELLDELNIKILTGYGLYSSSDGGTTWEYSAITNQSSLTNMFWLDSENCYSSGSGGMIMHSNDSGHTWEEFSSGMRAHCYDVFFIDAMKGIIVGSNFEEAVVYFTNDGGYNWESGIIDTVSITTYLRALVYSPNGKAWAVGWWNMLSSNDHGATWQEVDNGFIEFAYNDIDLYQDKYLWAGGTYGHLIRSDDHGATWEDISLPFEDHINIIEFCDSLHGLLTVKETLKSGYTHLYSTNNGGESWQQLLHPGDISPIWDISYPDKNTIFLSVHEAGIIKSSDGGETWEILGEVAGVHPRYLKFDVALTGIVALSDCMVAHTNDGGDSWDIDLSLETRYGLYPTYFHDRGHGWLVGDDGLIMKYMNPLVRIPEESANPQYDNVPWIYPNPASDMLRIRQNEPIHQIQVYDANGSVVMSERGRNISILNIEALPPGVYFVKLICSEASRIEKVIIR